MEEYIIPTAMEMVMKSDALGIDHLKPALGYIGELISHIKDHQLVDRKLNVYCDEIFKLYGDTLYSLDDEQIIRYLKEDLGYDVTSVYKDNRLYSIALKW
nr:MAG TPA: hypothetical protein [Caudoviricetes sp.]